MGRLTGGGVVSYQVNRLGEVKGATDRAGTTHAYTFDVVGRPTADAVTTLGAGVDAAVLRQETAYDTAGRAYLFTSFDAAAGGNVVNQVQRDFNGLGQLTRESQAVAGAVGGETPYVGYAYSEMAAGANHSRPTGMRYPDGKELAYDYGPGLNDAISRLSSLSDASGVLEGYDYLGLGTVVRRSRPQPGTELTYIKQLGEADSDAGDPYAGLDRFGRVVDQRWLGGGAATDRFKYGYDRDGNRLYRENLVDAAFSELYHADGPAGGYDLLNQLKEFRRGALSDADGDGVPDTVSSPSRSQSWGLDAVGNFATVTTDGVAEERTHNAQNQAVAVGGAALAYDANGALTTDEQGRSLRYDAWGRLVEVKQGSVVLASYGYDALGRRVTEGARELYYSASWQVVEERESGLVLGRLVFSPVYVDALVLREAGDGIAPPPPPPPPPPGGGGPGPLGGPVGPGGPPGTPAGRVWVQQDANWNVTSLAGDGGAVLERYVYDPYGASTVLTPGWGPRAASLYEWRYLHQGGRADPATGLVHFRNRDYSPTLGRWLRNDPLGFAAGDQNLYRAYGNDPTGTLDPSGLLSDNIQRSPNPNGTVALYYKYERSYFHHVATLGVGAFVEASTSSVFIGSLDPNTGLVRRGKRTVALAHVQAEARRAFTTSDWAAWFVANGTVDGETNSTWMNMQAAAGVSASRAERAEVAEKYLKPLAYQAMTAPLSGPGVTRITDASRLLTYRGPIPATSARASGASSAKCASGASAIAQAPRAKGGTYVLRDPATNRVMRSGRTNDLASRRSDHSREFPTLNFEEVHRTDVYAEQRGLEQLLHQHYNPPLNRIGGIDARNARHQEYLDAAAQFLQRQKGGG